MSLTAARRVDGTSLRFFSLFVCTIAAAATTAWMMVDARPTFRVRIPNGNAVIRMGQAWQAVGHTTSNTGSLATVGVFGAAFRQAGFMWTTALCQLDSDGDGYSNGAELGDPNCSFEEGQTVTLPPPYRTTGITHPGFADSFPGPGGTGLANASNVSNASTVVATSTTMTTATAAPPELLFIFTVTFVNNSMLGAWLANTSIVLWSNGTTAAILPPTTSVTVTTTTASTTTATVTTSAADATPTATSTPLPTLTNSPSPTTTTTTVTPAPGSSLTISFQFAATFRSTSQNNRLFTRSDLQNQFLALDNATLLAIYGITEATVTSRVTLTQTQTTTVTTTATSTVTPPPPTPPPGSWFRPQVYDSGITSEQQTELLNYVRSLGATAAYTEDVLYYVKVLSLPDKAYDLTTGQLLPNFNDRRSVSEYSSSVLFGQPIPFPTVDSNETLQRVAAILRDIAFSASLPTESFVLVGQLQVIFPQSVGASPWTPSSAAVTGPSNAITYGFYFTLKSPIANGVISFGQPDLYSLHSQFILQLSNVYYNNPRITALIVLPPTLWTTQFEPFGSLLGESDYRGLYGKEKGRAVAGVVVVAIILTLLVILLVFKPSLLATHMAAEGRKDNADGGGESSQALDGTNDAGGFFFNPSGANSGGKSADGSPVVGVPGVTQYKGLAKSGPGSPSQTAGSAGGGGGGADKRRSPQGEEKGGDKNNNNTAAAGTTTPANRGTRGRGGAIPSGDIL